MRFANWILLKRRCDFFECYEMLACVKTHVFFFLATSHYLFFFMQVTLKISMKTAKVVYYMLIFGAFE